MARSRKKTFSQKIVGVATAGAPSSVRKYLGNRVIASLIVLSVPVLLATGVVSVNWESGRPKLSINRRKAAEVEEKAAEKIQELREERSGDRPGVAGLVPHFGSQQNSRSGFAEVWRPDEGFAEKVEERVEELKDHFSDDRGHAWNLAPATGEQESAEQPANGPLSRLKQRFESRR